MRAHSPLLAAAAGFALFALGCGSGGVGDPCTPEDEYSQTFSGFKETEVSFERRSFQCETRVCLVNHFRGRVSCPYGQSEADLTLAPNDPARCRIPGTSGRAEDDAITVTVPPQLYSRTAAAAPERTGVGKVEDAVYCSCRCANTEGRTDDGARYCECPSGFSCARLVGNFGFGAEQLPGSYCIRDGSELDVGEGETCSRVSKNCGNDGKNP
jgi:hypothetical protein